MYVKPIFVLGLMSGSSLDGLDLAFCKFEEHAESLDWQILKADTMSFSPEWITRLEQLPKANAYTLAKTNADFGRYIGQFANSFLSQYNLEPDLIASHGHTVFHSPSDGFSLQIGDGAAIAGISGYTVVDNFRMQNIVVGGQGAPLAPIADQLLFPEYDFLLNLGGIANLSCKTPKGHVAFDISGANQILNALVRPIGFDFDEDGEIASSGKILPDLLQKVEQLPFFSEPYPKSLGNDWVQETQLPIYLSHQDSIANKLHTACWQIARQISKSIGDCIHNENLSLESAKMMASGGGVFNTFLLDCIKKEAYRQHEIVVETPSEDIIAYKEALLMALMGYLRLKKKPNCLPIATGSKRPVVSGALHWGWKRKAAYE